MMLISERRFRISVRYGTFTIEGIPTCEPVSDGPGLIDLSGPVDYLQLISSGNDFAPTVLTQLWDGEPDPVDGTPTTRSTESK